MTAIARLVLGFASSIPLLLCAADARACSCTFLDPAAARDAAGLVFEGVLLHHEATGPDSSTATFRVERVWRGRLRPLAAIRTPGLSTMCPPHFLGRAALGRRRPSPPVRALRRRSEPRRGA